MVRHKYLYNNEYLFGKERFAHKGVHSLKIFHENINKLKDRSLKFLDKHKKFAAFLTVLFIPALSLALVGAVVITVMYPVALVMEWI